MTDTFRDKYNRKFGFPKNTSHSLLDISKKTGVSISGINQIYLKGMAAFYNNPSSVRPTVKSPQQWAFGRVFSAVMKGPAAKIDAKELLMR